MIYIPSKQRYVLTSSYNKAILTLDNQGNWLERRNPGGKLQQPFAICLGPLDEILVGDNMAKCIFVFDVNLKYLKTIAEKTVFGFFDMDYDATNNDLYTVSLYDSLMAIIDFKKGTLKKKVFISTPAYIRVASTQLFIISAADLIYVINKSNFEVNYTIRIKNNKYVNGLFTDKYQNVYTTAHEDKCDDKDDNENKTDKFKEVYLCYISFQEQVQIKRVNLGLTQVNDFFLLDNNQMVFISDTHVDFFTFDGFSGTNDPRKNLLNTVENAIEEHNKEV